VIAHEIGHHVQKQLGISDEVRSQQQRASQAEANELSVRQELQADFFAGVWAHHAQQNWKVLDPGDIEEALRAANQIGDDRLQMKSRGFVVPESSRTALRSSASAGSYADWKPATWSKATPFPFPWNNCDAGGGLTAS
jgi:predicted metalloprotease